MDMVDLDVPSDVHSMPWSPSKEASEVVLLRAIAAHVLGLLFARHLFYHTRQGILAWLQQTLTCIDAAALVSRVRVVVVTKEPTLAIDVGAMHLVRFPTDQCCRSFKIEEFL